MWLISVLFEPDVADLCTYHTFYTSCCQYSLTRLLTLLPPTLFLVSFLRYFLFSVLLHRTLFAPSTSAHLPWSVVAPSFIKPQHTEPDNGVPRSAPTGERTSESGRAVVPRSRGATAPRCRVSAALHRGVVGGVCVCVPSLVALRAVGGVARLRVSMRATRATRRMRDDGRDDTTTTLNAVGLKAVRPEGSA